MTSSTVGKAKHDDIIETSVHISNCPNSTINQSARIIDQLYTHSIVSSSLVKSFSGRYSLVNGTLVFPFGNFQDFSLKYARIFFTVDCMYYDELNNHAYFDTSIEFYFLHLATKIGIWWTNWCFF